MTLDEILKMIDSFSKELFNVNLTGGETFMFPWLEEVIDAYMVRTEVKSILITTHGGFTEKTLPLMNNVCNRYPEGHFVVSISIDGMEELHNRLRQMKGLYQKALATYRGLLKLNKPNLDAQINIVLQKENQNVIKKTIRHLVETENIHSLTLSIVRGDTSDPHSKDVDVTLYQEAANLIEYYIHAGKLRQFKRNTEGFLLNAKNTISRRVIGRIARTGDFVSPCVAGRFFGVVYADGTVYPCELLTNSRLGNLREVGYNFKTIWTSDRTTEVRRSIIENKCTCTYECAWTANILFNPAYYPMLFWESFKSYRHQW